MEQEVVNPKQEVDVHFFPFSSLFFGNLYIYLAWHGHDHISGTLDRRILQSHRLKYEHTRR